MFQANAFLSFCVVTCSVVTNCSKHFECRHAGIYVKLQLLNLKHSEEDRNFENLVFFNPGLTEQQDYDMLFIL